MPRGLPRSSPRGSSNYDNSTTERLSRIRPDLIIQGVGSLVVGIITTIAVHAVFEDSLLYGIMVWTLVGTPCCIISGISSVSTILGTYDPMSVFGKSMRCDVTNGDMLKHLDV
jgi:hypothetical protein